MKVLNCCFGIVKNVNPCHSGQTLIRVKTFDKGNLHYYVDICYVEEGQRVNPNQELGEITDGNCIL